MDSLKGAERRRHKRRSLPVLGNFSMSDLPSDMCAGPRSARHDAAMRESGRLYKSEDAQHMERASACMQPCTLRETNGDVQTELCRSFQETGSCRYGRKCQFAHGYAELQPVQRHPKYKTQICRTYAHDGFCPYGPRCRFIHEPLGDPGVTMNVYLQSSAATLLTDAHGSTQGVVIAEGQGTMRAGARARRQLESASPLEAQTQRDSLDWHALEDVLRSLPPNSPVASSMASAQWEDTPLFLQSAESISPDTFSPRQDSGPPPLVVGHNGRVAARPTASSAISAGRPMQALAAETIDDMEHT